MEIPSFLWMPIVVVIVGLLGWLLRLEYRLGRGLTREEHERICGAKHNEVKEQLAEIKELLTVSAKDDREYRERVSNALHTMQLQVAVLNERGKQNDRG